MIAFVSQSMCMQMLRSFINIHAIFFPVIEMNLPVVADRSLEGEFSYYPACPQRCIQRCHYST